MMKRGLHVMNSKIDFVITWVDGNDPAWQKERAVYSKSSCMPIVLVYCLILFLAELFNSSQLSTNSLIDLLVFKVDSPIFKIPLCNSSSILKIYINLKLYVLTKLKLLSILSTPTN